MRGGICRLTIVFLDFTILWTALSVALGLELRGEYIRGVPCIKRHQQLYCPTAGNSYPLDRIELFIDENKALMKRMYGEFDMPEYEPESGGGGRYAPGNKRKRSVKPGVPDIHLDPGPDIHIDAEQSSKKRTIRQNFKNMNFNNNKSNDSGRVDACESKLEIVTPYWASNSAGKIRAIVNTQHFEQAIHQEVCAKSSTKRCSGDCGCEQKYKWHRLLAYDPDNDCRGIFMDWFLFPSCCVCRCNP
ncbi:protein spaetzle 3-like [Sitophilus oryzae]|uniref:Protein spaetzle 3-like n=1 Tax=Sitophilus oryzae TaxID=7048 RepID=A0A6J2YHT1_SITOR|nr:protein spaetzle 3-like [Sitophilus oryzae]